MGSPSNGQRRRAAPPAHGVRVPHPRAGSRGTAGGAPVSRPDLAIVAREAVVGFLRDASSAAAEPELVQSASGTGQPGVTAVAVADPWVGSTSAQAIALRAGAVGVATLDRIESVAAAVEADIAAAVAAQADLQAQAGAVVERAVQAALGAWAVGGPAHARTPTHGLRRVGTYTLVIAAMVAALLILLLVFVRYSAL